MAIELIREAFKVEERVGKSDIQALVETEIYLSQSQPNIEKILWVQGKVDILNTKIIQDKLIISGLAKFNILYKSDEEEDNIHTIDTNKEFREELEIQGVTDEMISSVSSKIEYIEWELEENKVLIKALIDLLGQVDTLKTIEIIKEIQGKNLQTLKETINYKEVHGREISYALIKEVLRLSEDKAEIDEILKLSIDVKEIESMVVEDRIITSGEIVTNLIYYGGNQINSHKETIPFNHFIEMPGVHKDLKGSVDFQVVEGIYEIVGNELGEHRLLDLEVKIKVTGKAFEEKTRDLIIDAYSTKENVLLEREEISIKENVKEIKFLESINYDIKDIDPREVLEVNGITTIVDQRYADDSIIIEGFLALEVHYIDRLTDELATFREDFPFKSRISEECSQSMLMEASANLDSIKYFLKKDSFILEGNILINISLDNQRKIYGLKEIKETGVLLDKKNKPSITIYIVQKGDVLWDIAKRYKTTPEEILISNNKSSAELFPGDKIIIEKKVELVNI